MEDARRIRRIVHEINWNKDWVRVQSEMGKFMHHDEQELLSVWEGWHWDDNKGGWLDPELCAKAGREEVEYIRRHKMHTRVQRNVLTLNRKGTHQDGMGGDRQVATREAQLAREVGREGAQDARKKTVRVNTATRGAENCAVRDRHGQAWRKSRGAG